jgi:DNA repair exonuclease SbcCD nuclease subunit
MIKFSHLADLHLGGYRQSYLSDLNFKTFVLAIDKVIELESDFCLFAGDIFDTPSPNYNLVGKVVEQIVRLKNAKIPLYIIGGSHDYTNLGNSILNVLEKTGLFFDLSNYKIDENNNIILKTIIDKKTNVLISGILGKKNGLDKNLYKNINELEKENKSLFKIFMFHCSINDFKPKFLENVNFEINKSFLPKGFDYYAGGHIHTNKIGLYNEKPISYSGALFPNNFSEFVREDSTFNFCEINEETKKLEIKKQVLNIYQKEYIFIECDFKTPLEFREIILKKIEEINVKNKIVLLKLVGTLKGKIIDLKINEFVDKLYNLGADFVLKNTYKLESELLSETFEIELTNEENFEEEIIEKIIEGDENLEEIELFKKLLEINFEKKEDEINTDFENRLIKLISDLK